MPAQSGTRKGPSQRMKHYIKRSKAAAERAAKDDALWARLDEPPKGEPMTREEFRKRYGIGE